MASERYTGMAAVLESIRREPGITQANLIDRVGLGRSVVAERVAELEESGLLLTRGRAPSTGGRAPRLLTLNSEVGYVVGVDVFTNEVVVGAANLAGEVLEPRLREQIDVGVGPAPIIERIVELISQLVGDLTARGMPLGVGIGLPGPVNVDKGMPVAVPVLPGWEHYPVQAELSKRLHIPVWVDGRVNLLALAELVANPSAARVKHLLYFGAGAGSGAALIVDGALYRGAHGLAGAIGHIPVPEAGMVVCRCGKVGCLEAVSGGWAIARDGLLLATSGRSAELARIFAETGTIRAYDITLAAEAGDLAANELLARTAALLGKSLASLVSLFAPEMLIIGGGIARAGEIVLGPIREVLLDQLPDVAAQDFTVELSVLDDLIGGVLGATQLAVGELFSKEQLPRLIRQMAMLRQQSPVAV